VDEMSVSFSRLVTELVDRSAFFRRWSPGTVSDAVARVFLTEFEGLVSSFPQLLALGIARTTDTDTRTVLAVNLYQECGEGNPARTHHAIYRNFMDSVGLPAPAALSPRAARWRESLYGYVLATEDESAVLGTLAAGEFLARPALSRIYRPIERLFPGADTKYFTQHLDLEAEHERDILELIGRTERRYRCADGILTGFTRGLRAWDEYFSDLCAACFEPELRETA
jgi:pyrroloquinoline quinone (PQQ) biosynthesis protein C